jgi:hypothetical protein
MIVTLLLCAAAAALAKTSARRDRPVRAAGHTLTTHLLEEWAPSSDIRVARREGHDRHANNINIRQDPFERTPITRAESLNNAGGGYMNDFMGREFCRFVLVQQEVARLAQTAIESPQMQAPASFNLEAVKREVEETIKGHEGQ